MLTHNDLKNYYRTTFALAQHHKYSLGDIEGIFPFERDFYVDMLLEHLEELKDAQRRGN